MIIWNSRLNFHFTGLIFDLVHAFLLWTKAKSWFSDIHLFKENLKPMWEEEGNRLGGKWILRLKKGLSTRLWELLLFAVIGEQFNVGKEICGIVCSIRPQEDLISIWTKTANNQVVTQRIKETMKKVLNLPQDCKSKRIFNEKKQKIFLWFRFVLGPLEYKTHNDSLRDNCSYRNTDRVRWTFGRCQLFFIVGSSRYFSFSLALFHVSPFR